jgi:hypothetical protein
MAIYHIVLVIFAGVATVSSMIDCDDPTHVQCKDYLFNLTQYHTVQQECRWKALGPHPDVDRAGMEPHGYYYLWYSGKSPENTVNCKSDMLATKTPDNANGYGGVDEFYKTCCVPTILMYCKLSVNVFMDCNGAGRGDDEINHVVAMFESCHGQSVRVVLNPDTYTISCTYIENGVESETKYVTSVDGTISEETCVTPPGTKKEIKVKIIRKPAVGDVGPILRAIRYDCGAQYVSIFTQADGKFKFTTKTRVTNYNKYIYESTYPTWPTVAFTGWSPGNSPNGGFCGDLVESVVQTYPPLH